MQCSRFPFIRPVIKGKRVLKSGRLRACGYIIAYCILVHFIQIGLPVLLYEYCWIKCMFILVFLHQLNFQHFQTILGGNKWFYRRNLTLTHTSNHLKRRTLQVKGSILNCLTLFIANKSGFKFHFLEQ